MIVTRLHRDIENDEYTDRKAISLDDSDKLIEVKDESVYRILCDCHIKKMDITPILQDNRIIGIKGIIRPKKIDDEAFPVGMYDFDYGNEKEEF